jgi:hypothetical protein
MINIAKALVQAQKEMGNAVKDSKNPFFKSSYADLNSVREACLPELNKNGIVVLQPICQVEGKSYVKTVLLHESGESLESMTEIVYGKQGDAQAQGSGITYARRYGLQSLVCIGAEDDDGNKASEKPKETKTEVRSDEDVRVLAENWFKTFKAKAEKSKSLEELNTIYKSEENALKRLNKACPDLYDLLEDCRITLEATF